MAEPLKNLYSPSFFNHLGDLLAELIPDFSKNTFIEDIHDNDWEDRELKERMVHIANVLHCHFPGEYKKSVQVILNLTQSVSNSPLADHNFEFIFLPTYIEGYGLEHYEESIEAMESLTQFISCEFAVRPFILKYPDRMMVQMELWALHENHHVRRLASEGCRPRLPWASALNEFKKDPAPILPILETLKSDSSEYVRRSVANNLNDIAKDHPDLVLDICQQWIGESKETDRLVKHACRTLLKRAHPKALAMFGYDEPTGVQITDFKHDQKVKIGGGFNFGFTIIYNKNKSKKLRIEYGIDYLKSNGSQNRKIFKLSDLVFKAENRSKFSRSQSFRNMTTRKHYTGQHKIVIIVNGKEMASGEFEVVG
tara:strand:- start:6619 stop:7722 length:1104 start_codon:yes stop_codon:yes gene_type:complete